MFAGNGGKGSDISITSGTGGNAMLVKTPGNGGDINIITGAGGTGGVGVAKYGNIYLAENGGSIVLGSTGTPNARVFVAGGTASVASLQISDGVFLTTPKTGCFEFVTDTLFFTTTTGPTRRLVVLVDTDSWTEGDVPYITTDGRLESQTPVADGTYTVGLGEETDGTITITNGIISAIQEAS